MKTWAKYTTGVAATLTLAAIGTATYAGVQAAPQATIGTAYAAHAACGKWDLQNKRDSQPDLPEHPLTKLISPESDRLDNATSATIFGLYESTAFNIPGAGCVLAKNKPHFPDSIPEIGQRVEQTIGKGIGVPQGENKAHPGGRRINEAITRTMKTPGTRGIVVLKDGELISERYSEGFDKNTVQLGWSMTKSLANVLAGRVAHEDPKFNVEADHLREEWNQPGDKRATITIDNLLRMSSGLEWHEEYDTFGDTPEMLYHSEDMPAYVASKPLEHTPGEHRKYSTGSTTLACDALHQHTGMGIDMAWKLLFKPLGMASAQLEPDATGHLVCGSSAWATPRDWAKLGQFVLQDGRVAPGAPQLLPAGWMEEATTEKPAIEDNATPGEPTSPYGSGWWLNKRADGSLKWKDLPEDLFLADGHDGQYMVIVPSENIVVVRQGFTPGATVESTGTLELVREAIAATQE